MRVVSWFSCGDASAVATKLALSQFPNEEVIIARCVVPEEHEDNERFARDCARWFGKPVLNLKSVEFADCEEVWTRRRYMSGPRGAPCTVEMKKAVRWQFEREWGPDLQVFGFTVEETARAARFRQQNPEVNLITPLVEAVLDKATCHQIVAQAGIEIPAMYRLGFNNNNCIGCVKATSPAYWNRVRQEFPEVFARRAQLSREIGCRLTRVKNVRKFLDELEPTATGPELALDCGILCEREAA